MEEILFEGDVPVTVQQKGREEKRLVLHFVLRMSSRANSIESKALFVQVTEESDPYFLYFVEVEERSFQELRLEQSLLVDFAKFPDDLVRLLSAVIESARSDREGFVAYLIIADGPCSPNNELLISQRNPLRLLKHISLRLRAGDDAAVKRYLADQLRLFKSRFAALSGAHEELDTTSAMRAAATDRQLSELRAQLETAAVAARETAADMRLAHAEATRALSERANETLVHAQAASQARLDELSAAARAQSETLGAKIAALQDESLSLSTRLADAEAKGRETTAALTETTRERDRIASELATLRAANLGLDGQKHAAHLSIGELRVRQAALEQQVADKEALVASLTAALDAAKAEQARAVDSAAGHRAATERAESRLAAAGDDLGTANRIITRLQSEIAALKGKLKLRSTMALQQEQRLDEADKAAAATAREVSRLASELQSKEDANGRLRGLLDDARRAIEEGKSQLEQNENTIKWLNKQCNEVALAQRNPFAALGNAAVSPALRPSGVAVPGALEPLPHAPGPLGSVEEATGVVSAYRTRPSYFESAPRPIGAVAAGMEAGAAAVATAVSASAATASGGDAPAIFSHTRSRFADTADTEPAPGAVLYQPKRPRSALLPGEAPVVQPAHLV